MPSGVYLTFFASFVFGTPGFPLSDVPLQDIAKKVEQGKFQRNRHGYFASKIFGKRIA
jgi:hypothetical protein